MAIGDKIHLINKEEVQGAIGNISNPLLDLPLNNSLAMKQGVGSVEFTRSTTATYIDRYGVLKTADIDEPRFEKDGLLIEGSSTNVSIHSQTFTDSSYAIANNGTFTQDVDNIDGSTDAVKFTTSTEEETQQFNKTNFPATDNATFTTSATVEQSGDYVYFQMTSGNFSAYETRGTVVFNLQDGLVVSENTDDGEGNITGAITDLGNGRYRCELRGQVWNDSGNNSHCYMSVRKVANIGVFEGDGTSGVILHNFQVEVLPFATSYIPTTDSAVTRGTDLCEVTAKDNIPIINEGFTFLMTYTSNSFVASRHLIDFGDSRRAGYIQQYNDAGFTYWSGSTDLSNKNSDMVLNSGLTGRTARIGMVVKNKLPYCIDDGVIIDNSLTREASISVPTTIKFGVGNHTNFGYIKNFKIWDKALTATEVALA